jgi:hypothetical protein
MTQLGEKSVLSYEPAGIIEIFNLLLFPRYSWPKQRPRVIDHPLEMQPSSLTPRTTANIIKYFGLFIPTKKKKNKKQKRKKEKNPPTRARPCSFARNDGSNYSAYTFNV